MEKGVSKSGTGRRVKTSSNITRNMQYVWDVLLRLAAHSAVFVGFVLFGKLAEFLFQNLRADEIGITSFAGKLIQYLYFLTGALFLLVFFVQEMMVLTDGLFKERKRNSV